MSDDSKPGPWTECVRPAVERLRLASRLGFQFVHQPQGAGALADLLQGMAEKLDIAVAREPAKNPSRKDVEDAGS